MHLDPSSLKYPRPLGLTWVSPLQNPTTENVELLSSIKLELPALQTGIYVQTKTFVDIFEFSRRFACHSCLVRVSGPKSDPSKWKVILKSLKPERFILCNLSCVINSNSLNLTSRQLWQILVLKGLLGIDYQVNLIINQKYLLHTNKIYQQYIGNRLSGTLR